MIKSKMIIIFAVFGLLFGLSACGKVSSPVPLEGGGYPHTYPRY